MTHLDMCRTAHEVLNHVLQAKDDLFNRGIPGPQKSTFSFWGRDQTFSKNVEIIIDVFRKGRSTKVENLTMSDVERSAPCIDISAAPAVAKRQILVAEKIHENAEGFAASKPSQMRDSDALLTLVGGELEAIYHGDPENWENLLTKQHGKGPV